MGLDGRLGDHERVGDLGVAHAAGDEPEDLRLARGQRRERLRRAGQRRGRLGEALDQPPGDGRREQRVPDRHGPDGGDELLGRDVLEQEAARARPAARRRRTRRGRRWSGSRSAAPSRPAAVGEEPARRLETVEPGHPDVHQDDVGSMPPCHGDGRRRRRRPRRRPSMSGWASRIIRKPARTSAWSSAIRTRSALTSRQSRRGTGRRLERQPRARRRTRHRAAAGLEPPADLLRPLAHPDQSAPGALARVAGRGRRARRRGPPPGPGPRSYVTRTSVAARRAYRSAFVSASWTIR